MMTAVIHKGASGPKYNEGDSLAFSGKVIEEKGDKCTVAIRKMKMTRAAKKRMTSPEDRREMMMKVGQGL